MYEPQLTDWTGVKLWSFRNDYTTNQKVIFSGKIYKAKANITGPVADTATPLATPASWDYVVDFVAPYVNSSDTLTKLRQKVDADGHAITNLNEREADREADVFKILNEAGAGFTGTRGVLNSRFSALEADVLNILGGTNVGNAHTPPTTGLESRLVAIEADIINILGGEDIGDDHNTPITGLETRIAGIESTTATHTLALAGLDARLDTAETQIDTLFDSGYWIWRGIWTTATVYRNGDIIYTGTDKDIYVCTTGHTSSAAFATDLASKWSIVLNNQGTHKRFELKTTSFTAVHGGSYFVNTSAGDVTITLPANPADASPTNTQDPINITHVDGDVTQVGQALIINRNSKRIMGFDEDMAVDKNFASFSMVYCNTTFGWRTTIL